MQYVNKTFTLPTTNRKMSQTDYEIAVGLRHPDGRLRQQKPLNPKQTDDNRRPEGTSGVRNPRH